MPPQLLSKYEYGYTNDTTKHFTRTSTQRQPAAATFKMKRPVIIVWSIPIS